jgi:hypothetical protein
VKINDWFDGDGERKTKNKNRAYFPMLQGGRKGQSTEEYTNQRREEEKLVEGRKGGTRINE